MLKNFGYGGAYRDEDLTVGVLLENPLDFGLESSSLTFSATIRPKDGVDLRLADFTFYIMDEAGCMYNAELLPRSKPHTDGDLTRRLDGIIRAEFKPEFLFQDLRIAFRRAPCEDVNLIKLTH